MAQISIQNLNFSYEGSPDAVFQNASIVLDSDWKLGLIGRNGRGKTTLLRLLHGDLDAHGAIHTNVHFDYFPFEVSSPDSTPAELAESMRADGETWQFYREASLLEFKITA